MKNNKKLVICIMIFSMILIIFFVFGRYKEKDNNKNVNGIDNKFELNMLETIDRNQISYQEDATINELKEETGATGNTEIYEMQTEYDGRKVLTVKASLKYKVAFAGMIKKSKPTMEELDALINDNQPTKNGIWIEKSSRKKMLEIFGDGNIKSTYSINDEGYLKIQDKNLQNDLDKKIENIIKGNKLYVLSVSSVCYIVDDITGEILDYNFENMDKYQTYEYFDDEDKMMVFINENSEEQLTNNEILNSIIELF